MTRGIGYLWAVLSLALTLSAAPAHSATIGVTANASDVLNGANGSCSLREAIANINAGAATYADCINTGAAYGTGDTINIPAGTYTHAIAGTLEDANADGDLDVNVNVAIVGAGASTTIIDGGAIENVLDVNTTDNPGMVFSISGVTIRNGSYLPGNGGGVYVYTGTASFTSVRITGNTAPSGLGGGVYVDDGTATFSDCTIDNNSADEGGGVYVRQQTAVVNIVNCTISGNTTLVNNGGGLFQYWGTVTVTGTTISGNTSAANGGGIYSDGDSLAITNSTISGNSAVNGGGIFGDTGLTSAITTNSTVAGNTAAGDGGGVYNGNVFAFANTLLSGNTSASGGDCSLGANAFTSNGHNLDSDGSCSLEGVGDISTGTANLAALANNGGLTQTHALLAGSDALDAGDAAVCAAAPVGGVDQRGMARPQGSACDIGAYERALYPVTVATSGSGGTASCSPNPVYHGDGSTCTASPDTGYSFTGWSGDCSGLSCVLANVTGPRSVTAGFAPVTSVTGPAATGSGTIAATVAGGGAACRFVSHQFLPLAAVLASPPAGSVFPHGLFEFTLEGCAAGGTVALAVTYPQALPAGTQYWKYGPTPDDATPHWYVMPATIAGNTATFSIADGGLGDDDLAANGTIVDQGGPAVMLNAVPTLSPWLLALLGLLLAWAGERHHFNRHRERNS